MFETVWTRFWKERSVLVPASTGNASANIDGTIQHLAFKLLIYYKGENLNVTDVTGENLNVRLQFK